MSLMTWQGHALVQSVEALRYKPEVRGFDSWWCINISGLIMALGSTQPLKEMSTRDISWGVKAASADITTTALKSGVLNLLELLELIQACNWIDLINR